MKISKKLFLAVTVIMLFNPLINAQWVNINSGTSNFLNCVEMPSIVKMYAAGFNGTFLFSADEGNTWTIRTAPSANNINTISFPPVGQATTGWAGSTGLFKTTNSGQNWTQQLFDTVVNKVLFITATTGYVVLNKNFIAKTTNGGTNFTHIQFTTDNSHRGKLLDISGNIMMLGATDGDSTFIYKSTNEGVTWQQIFKTGVNHSAIELVTIDAGFLCGSGGVIHRTTNGGANWQQVPSGTSVDLQNVLDAKNNIMYITGSSGNILKSTNSGQNWFLQNSNTGATLRGLDMINNGGIVLTCGTNGTMKKTTNGGVTSVTPTGMQIPETFSLSQNYPNPFNPQTTISFGIPTQNFVQLKVYDMLGREAAMIVNENLSAGSYSIELDAALLPSGTYFYRITAGEFSEVKKMILIK